MHPTRRAPGRFGNLPHELRGLRSQRRWSPARLAGAAVLIILAGYLLFAHGCHGDEDNELFSAVRWAVPGSR